YQRFVEDVQFGLYGLSVGWWCGYNTQIACPHEREMKGSRYRRSGQGQRIHISPHDLQFLFDRHTEFLFLIDNHESQILELDVFADQAMCTDNDIYLSFFEVLEGFLDLLGRLDTVDVIDICRHSFQPLGQGTVMLQGQDGRWYQNSDLFAIRHSLESGAYSHFCLAKTYISTDQPIHRVGAFHISLHVVGRFLLVGCIFIDKRSFQFLLQIGVWMESKTRLCLAFSIELDQVACDVLDLLFGGLLQLIP